MMSLRIGQPSPFFLSNVTQKNPLARAWKHMSQPSLRDELRLSNAALSIQGRLLEHNNAVSQWDNQVTQGDARPAVEPLKSVDQAISDIGKTLEEMKTISMLAENEDLTDEERIDLQIQVIELQSKLFKDTHRMSLEERFKATGKNPLEAGDALSFQIDESAELLIAMMEKMKTQVAKGEISAEGIDLSDFTLVRSMDVLDFETGEKTRSIRASALVFKGDPEASDTGLSAATLRELDLANSGATSLGVVVLDAKSAEKSTKRIQQGIDALQKLKDDMAQFSQGVPEEGYGDNGEELEMSIGKGVSMDGDTPVLFSQHSMEELQKMGNTTAAGAFSVYSAEDLLAPGPKEELPNPEPIKPVTDLDVRIHKPRHAMDAFIQKADDVFKDKIFKILGFSTGEFPMQKTEDNQFWKDRRDGNSDVFAPVEMTATDFWQMHRPDLFRNTDA